MTTTLEIKKDKTDAELKKDVLSELDYQPSVKATDIGVLVHDGTVTLNGYVGSYNEKWEATQAMKRVIGVKAIANEIEVKLPTSSQRRDEDIAAAAANQISWSTTIPLESVEITVHKGWITLEGEVEWWFQKSAAETVVCHIFGVKGVSNLILVKPRLTRAGVEEDIRSAFERSALLDANKVKVDISGNNVTLRGKVRNYDEFEEAERVAWAASGVTSVANHLKVQWFNLGD